MAELQVEGKSEAPFATRESELLEMLRLLPLLSLAALVPSAVAAQGDGADAIRSWQDEKCVRYERAWQEAVAALGTEGVGEEFVTRHEAFIASGCTSEHDVCPRSEAELEMANAMTVAAMVAGTASTFPPFGCPD